MFTPPDEDAFANSVPPEFLAPEALPANSLTGPGLTEDFNAGCLADYIADSILHNLPNDLTRMIYLASLRDCNSGVYLHPELSHQRGMAEADRAFRLCHERLFHTLLTTRLSEYVLQLQEYIRYSRSKTVTVLKAWKSLQAYRATVPLGAPAASTELFFLNLSIALEILSQQTSELQST